MVRRLQKSAITAAIVTLCLVLAAVLVFVFVPAPRKAYAENEVSTWDGDLAAAGWGQEEDKIRPSDYVVSGEVIEIGSAAALAYFAHEVYTDSAHALDGYTVKLMVDIDLNGETWIPIGSTMRSSNPSKRFSGTFDGNGHTISNLSSEGFYKILTETGTFKYEYFGHSRNSDPSKVVPQYGNYRVEYKLSDSAPVIRFDIDAGEYTFGLFGVTANMTVKNLTMSNVNIDLADKTFESLAEKNVDESKYDDKYSELGEKATTLIPDNVGAIIGHNEGSLLVENCVSGQQNEDGTAGSTIKIATKGNPAIGGLVGRAYARKQSGSATTTTFESVKIEDSKNYIDFEYDAIAIPGSTSDNYGKVSGILGYSTSFKNCEFINCVNYGNIDGGQFAAGMMAFFSDNSKNNLYSDATEKAKNAWNLNFDNCVNYGDITSSNLDTAAGFAVGKTYAAGIIADMSASTDNSNSILSSYANPGKLAAVNFYVTNCRNYGTIRAYNTEAKSSASTAVSETSFGYNIAGGIIGELYPSETGENEITNNYNYGNVESIAKEGSTAYTPRMGGYLGWLYFYWGAESTNHPNYISAANRPIDLTLTGGSCGEVVGEDRNAPNNTKRVNSLIGDTFTYPDKPCNIMLVDANDYSKNLSRGNIDEGQESVTVAANVTEIATGKYLGQSNLTDVDFAEGSTLTKIGDFAFAGTGLTQIYLPESVTEIGEAAFGKDVLVIAKDKAHYKKLVESDDVSDDVKELLTYVITVEYRHIETYLDDEYKLFGKEYAWACDNNGKWTREDNATLGTDETGNVIWYTAAASATRLTVDDVNELLKTDIEKLVLVTYDSDKKVFYARENIVYDGTSYGMTELNPLLHAAGDSILLTMTATIEGYVDPDGNAAADDDLPKVIRDAGTYTVRVVEGSEDYGTFDIKISRATVDLGAYSNLSWRLTAIGFDAANAELLNGNGITLYIYTDKDGKEYPSTTLLTDAQITELGLTNNGAYTTRTVLYSVVRNRNKNVDIRLAPNARYTADESSYDNNVGRKIGVYKATVELTAAKNYKFIATGINAQRGLTVAIEDGKTATVTKTWYIADMSNWLVSATGGEYSISDRVYGENAAAAAPRLRYGASSAISMELIHNGTTIGDSFGVSDFGRYINRAMPAGNYELVVTVEGVYSDEVDTSATTDPDNPVTVTVYRSGFTESIVFTVDKAPLPSLEQVDAALKGKTFTYTWDGASHLYDDKAAAVVNAYLGVSAISRANTVWADYNNLFGNFEIKFNLASMQSDAYYGANDTKVATANPDLYTVYYRISAPNYYSSTENLSSNEVRQNYYFEVVIIREIEVPEVSNVAYTGSAVFPTITPAATDDAALYEVLWATDGYLTGGQRTVTFRLRNSDYYCWVGEEVGIETVTVPFKVVEADNAWLRTPNIVSWLYEEYNTEVNRIRAVPKFLDEGQTVKFTVTDSEGNAVEGLSAFTVNEDGTLSDQAIIAALNGLKAGAYKLEVLVAATNNYKVLTADIDFNIGKAMNAWADGDEDLVLPGWIVGKYSATENVIVVNPAHGVANIIITDIDGNEYYNSVTGLNKLNDCEVGKYLLKAWVDETTDFAALAERTFTIEVFEKAGMPWWGTLLITLGALLVAALIIFILWKKGVFQLLTDKLLLAIRNKATVDATIAAVRANKRAEEAKKSVEAAKRRDALEERKAKAAEERALPAEQRAAALEEKARKAAERAEKMKARAEAMQLRAERMKEQANATEAPAEEKPKAETPASEEPVTEAPTAAAPATEEPKAEAPATEEPTAEAAATEQPVTEAPAAEEPKAEEPAAVEAAAAEAPATEESAPKTTKTPAKKKPSNKK